ncbi:membrane-associated progesterone binding protein 2 [Trypanosoma rangeli]|uniref:Membrane-associated progesterone binding protein 2 n=1 Tax=Trypanosoma rangeli TaxID=5698 RepID=A0A422NSD0_TRYRA|nr:membrane-associated progesterone binding protein 2 [Trypanosoma rangeli]RNF08339.1 membrane-associated progesterone binding protein 2 [Trypanosoma rangeli]|eukprot:RNF08339.1 membrane-associated progesterone binding protein 2 [Trypanosoma rangeli]
MALIFFHLFLRTRQHLVELAPKSVFIPRGYTLEELSEYDGVKKPLAFVSVRGVIYSCSMEMYGVNAPYNAFAGRDSSRHLGKVKVGREESNADWTTLSDAHLAALKDWDELLRSKYVAVGWIIPSKDFIKRAEAFEP